MLFRASGMPRTLRCGASVRFPQARPDVDTDPAREGTCAAWVAECVMNGDASSAEDYLGETHENGWVVDDDMVRHCQWYIDTIMARAGHHRAEVYVKHPTLPMAGTADHIGWSDDMQTLYVDDLKYGYKVVEATSPQLTAYLFLVLSNIPPEQWPKLVQLSILQPRALHKDGPYRKRVVSVAEMQPDLDHMQAMIEYVINTPDPVATPGAHCYRCAKALGCTALTQSVYATWEAIQSREYLDPTPEQLSTELTMLERMTDLFEARNTAVRAEADAKLAEGGFIPGWAVQKKFGNKKFTVDDVSIQMITGIDPTVKKTCTPAELIRRGARKEVVDTITTNPFIGTTIKRVDESDVAAHFAQAKH